MSCENLHEVTYIDPSHKKAVINPDNFTLPKENRKKDFALIDTASVYKWVEKTSVRDLYHFLKFNDSSEVVVVNKQSDYLENADFQIYPGSPAMGRYRINGNKIELEQFHANGPAVKKFTRILLSGKINGEKVILHDLTGDQIYIKIKQYSFGKNGLQKLR